MALLIKKTLFGATITPSCAYCAFNERMEASNLVRCDKKGITAPLTRCRFFSYDPLRRVPKQRMQMPSFSAEDFTLD